MRGKMLAVVIALLAAGCTTTGAETGPAPGASFSIDKLDAFAAGVTTRDEVIAVLGPPTREVPSLNNHTTLQYEFSRTPTTDNPDTSVIIVVLLDPQNRFVRWRGYGKQF